MHKSLHNKEFKIFLIAVILLLTFIVIFHPHKTYKYPFHIDEWKHISLAKRIATNEYSLNFELGFNLFLAFFMKLGLDLVLFYKYLPAVFACISNLALFFLVYIQTKKFYLATLSMLFFIILPTNINILGIKFFTPLTLAIPFIYLFMLLFTQGFEKQNTKLVFYSFLVFLILLFIHPLSAVFMLPIILIYVIPYKSFIKKNKLKLSSILLCPLIFILAYAIIFKLNLHDILILFKQNILFYKGWTPLEIKYSIINLYKLLPFLFASLGFFLAFRKKEWRIFIIWALVTFILLKTFIYFHVSVFAPYQRVLYYFMLSAAPLSAIGFYQLLSYLWKFLPKIFAMLLTFTLVGLFLFYHISFSVSEEKNFYYVINDYAYETIKFLESQEGLKVIAPKNNLSIALYPISGQIPMATAYFYGNENAKADLDRFFGADCSVKEEIIRDHYVSYVIDTGEETCGWEKIYDKGFKIYLTRYGQYRIRHGQEEARRMFLEEVA